MLIKDEEAPDSKVQIEGVATPNSEGGADITIQAGIAVGNGDSDLFNVNNFGPLSLKFVGPDGFVFMNAAIEITPDESMKPYKSYVFEDKLLKPDSPSRGIVLQLKKTVVNPGDRNEEVSITPTDGKVSIPDLSDGTWTGTYSANSCDFSPPSLKFLSYRAQKRTTPDKLTINVLEKVPRNCMNDAANQNLIAANGEGVVSSNDVPSSVICGNSTYQFKIVDSQLNNELRNRLVTQQKASKIIIFLGSQSSPDSNFLCEGVAMPNLLVKFDVSIDQRNNPNDNVAAYGPKQFLFAGPDGYVFLKSMITIVRQEVIAPTSGNVNPNLVSASGASVTNSGEATPSSIICGKTYAFTVPARVVKFAMKKSLDAKTPCKLSFQIVLPIADNEKNLHVEGVAVPSGTNGAAEVKFQLTIDDLRDANIKFDNNNYGLATIKVAGPDGKVFSTFETDILPEEYLWLNAKYEMLDMINRSPVTSTPVIITCNKVDRFNHTIPGNESTLTISAVDGIVDVTTGNLGDGTWILYASSTDGSLCAQMKKVILFRNNFNPNSSILYLKKNKRNDMLTEMQQFIRQANDIVHSNTESPPSHVTCSIPVSFSEPSLLTPDITAKIDNTDLVVAVVIADGKVKFMLRVDDNIDPDAKFNLSNYSDKQIDFMSPTGSLLKSYNIFVEPENDIRPYRSYQYFDDTTNQPVAVSSIDVFNNQVGLVGRTPNGGGIAALLRPGVNCNNVQGSKGAYCILRQ